MPNPKELNPHLKDNGSGFPADASPVGAATGQLLSSSVVGDGGASWRLKSLKRAKEQAAREGRRLDEVVEERWGSLGRLAASVSAQRIAPSNAHLHAKEDRKGQLMKSESVAGEVEGGSKGVQPAPRECLRGVSSRHSEMRKPKQDSVHLKKNKKQKISAGDSLLISEAISGINKFANDGSFMGNLSRVQNKDDDVSDSYHASREYAYDLRENDIDTSKLGGSNRIHSVNTQGLSANQLAAKVLQFRMEGRHEEAEKLSKEMGTIIDKPDTDNKVARQGTKLNSSREMKDDPDLRLARNIIQNKRYSLDGRVDDEYELDGAAPSGKCDSKKEEMYKEKQNIPKRLLTQQERCNFCFENLSRLKHLVVSIGNFTYMMLARSGTVVDGQCCILPMQHDSSTRTVDKNVWDEIRNFKKCLLRMFAAQGKDVLFIETVINMSKQRRHCLVECIPVSSDIAKQAPGYFKKAIDESEDEWGQHEMKKVIRTNGELRTVIPENLSYFHVEFGLDRGFVHVIDDDANFPSGFGQNVVRCMLRLPEVDMHGRRQHESMEKQEAAVANFAKEWASFDWTRDLD